MVDIDRRFSRGVQRRGRPDIDPVLTDHPRGPSSRSLLACIGLLSITFLAAQFEAAGALKFDDIVVAARLTSLFGAGTFAVALLGAETARRRSGVSADAQSRGVALVLVLVAGLIVGPELLFAHTRLTDGIQLGGHLLALARRGGLGAAAIRVGPHTRSSSQWHFRLAYALAHGSIDHRDRLLLPRFERLF